MNKRPYFLLLSGLSVGFLLVLNWNLRTRYSQREKIADAQTLVATGQGSPSLLRAGSRIASEYLREDPNHAQALFVRAWGAQRQGEFSVAKESYQRLFHQLTEHGKYAYFNYGVILEAEGQSQAAVEQLLKSTSFDPTLDFAWARAARILLKEGRADEARIFIEQGLASSPASKELLELQRSIETKSN